MKITQKSYAIMNFSFVEQTDRAWNDVDTLPGNFAQV